MTRITASLVIAMAVCLFAAPPASVAQVLQGAALPANWRELEAHDFIAAVRSSVEAGTVDEPTLAAIRDHAKQQLLAPTFVAAKDYYSIQQLFELSKPILNEQETTQVRGQLATRNEAVAEMPFWSMQARAELLENLTSPQQARELVSAWCDGNGELIDASDREKAEFDELYEEKLFNYRVRWLLSHLRYETVNGAEFSAVWTGTITAPRTGEYKFSTTPINPSFGNPAEGQHFHHLMRISVSGQQLVNARWNNWDHVGAPIALTAGQSTPIRVEYTHSRKVGGATDQHTSGNECPVAMLFAEGPGIARSVVPTEVLSPPDGQGQGLLGTFQSSQNGQPVTATMVDPRIDHVWLSGTCIVPQHATQQNWVIDRAWKRYSDPTFIERCRQQKLRWPLLDEEVLVECLTHEQRLAVVDSALKNPDLVNSQPWLVARQFFMNYRHDAPDKALDVLGRWMVAHADDGPEFGGNFFKLNLYQYRLLADALFFHYPEHGKQLELNYLTTKDGRCVLPVAYTVAYGHRIRDVDYNSPAYVQQKHGNFEQWIEKLDDQLADVSVAGETRINWLLARAQAQEIMLGPKDRHAFDQPNLSMGREWIDEAQLVAESDATRVRLAKEWITRLTWMGQTDQALLEVNAIGQSTTDPAVRTAVDGWRTAVEQRAEALAEKPAEERRLAAEMYRRHLEEFRDTAALRGDTVGADQYQRFIDEMKTDP
jgi:PA14 domain